VFSPEIFKHIPANEFYDFGKQVFPSLQQTAAPFYGFDARGAYWCDIGTPDEYRRASFDVVEGVFAIPGTRANGASLTADVADDARVDGDVWIGSAARVGPGVTIVGPSVIGDSVTIAPNARIERSILWGGATIGADATIRDSIVGKDYYVEDGTNLESAVVANEPTLSS
jgi:NDP-sugar pyrophosphorylase family protein